MKPISWTHYGHITNQDSVHALTIIVDRGFDAFVAPLREHKQSLLVNGSCILGESMAFEFIDRWFGSYGSMEEDL